MQHKIIAVVFLVMSLGMQVSLPAQTRPSTRPSNRPAPFNSPEVSTDRKITFRLFAPKAEKVRLLSSDLPKLDRGIDMIRTGDGIWKVEVGPFEPGAYRYVFLVDSVSTLDPKNNAVSLSNANKSSLVNVPGSPLFDHNDVPHGAVSTQYYRSKSLNAERRLHVYTPPGYEKSAAAFPVLYLLHGAMDCDDSWTSVGRANYILDNLIATGKATPMIVVMPDGHTDVFQFGGSGGKSFNVQMEEFEKDFSSDIRPYIEKNYRVIADRAHRAIAGLSMGGAHTLDIAFSKLEDFGYIGVFSSGIFGITGNPNAGPNTQWEDAHKPTLDNAELKNGLKLFWIGVGKEDFLVPTSTATIKMFQSHGFEITYRESGGGHTWLNWRDYLGEFAPKLFQN